ncbi:PIG-P [Powellomyces hirtus]|nr:PIG-P [Powellomyces hirtus]
MPSPPASPTGPVPTQSSSEFREYYGFVVYLTSFVAFATYLVWALCSDEVINGLGVYYYPTRWWALVLPVYILGLIPFTILMFTGTNLYRTPPLTSFDTISEEKAKVLAFPLDAHKLKKLASEDSIPEIEDIPLSIVNQILYK